MPLYNVPQKSLLDIEGIKKVYSVENTSEKQMCVELNCEDVTLGQLVDADGVIIVFDDCNVYETAQKLNMSTIKEEEIEGMKILYGYTTFYSGHIYIDGKQVNVQLVQKQNEVIAGFPIILTGY